MFVINVINCSLGGFRMNSFQALGDKFSIALSAACAVHCLALPLLLIAFPVLTSTFLAGEALHLAILIAVVPLSACALYLGCRQHRSFSIVVSGYIGLSLMILAAIFEEGRLNDFWTKVLTLFAAAILAYSHYQNYRRCKAVEPCSCAT